MIALTFSTDALLENIAAPDVVKIDVEGAEIELLKSASKLLGTVRPSFAIEVGPDNAPAVTSILSEHGYTMFDGPAGYHDRRPVPNAAWNTIAVPGEKLG